MTHWGHGGLANFQAILVRVNPTHFLSAWKRQHRSSRIGMSVGFGIFVGLLSLGLWKSCGWLAIPVAALCVLTFVACVFIAVMIAGRCMPGKIHVHTDHLRMFCLGCIHGGWVRVNEIVSLDISEPRVERDGMVFSLRLETRKEGGWRYELIWSENDVTKLCSWADEHGIAGTRKLSSDSIR